MAVSTNRSRISEILGTDSKPKAPSTPETGSRVAQILGVETPEAARQAIYKPAIGPTTYDWVEEGYIDSVTPGWQKALSSGPVGGFFNAIQKPLALGSSLAKESIDMVTGQGFDFGDLRQQYNENYTFGRLLHDYDLMQNRDSGWQKFGAAALGFTGDVLLDPLTYIGLVGKIPAFAAKLAAGGARNLGRKAIGETLKRATIGQIAARAGDDVARTVGDDVFQMIGDEIATGALKNAGKGAKTRLGNVVVRRGRSGYEIDVIAREGLEEGTQEFVAATVKLGDSIADDLTDFSKISAKAQQKGASLLDPEEVRRAAGFVARSQLDEAGRAAGSQGYKGAYLTAEEAMNASIGIGFKVPGTGPIGRALRIADPIANAINKVTRRGVSAPVGIRVMTSETPIIGKIAMSLPRGVRSAVNRAGLSKVGKALVGGRMNALKRTLRETSDHVLIQQGKRAIHAVARGTAIGRRIKPVLQSLANDVAKTISHHNADPTEVYHALGGDTTIRNILNEKHGEGFVEGIENTVAQMRLEANRAGRLGQTDGRDFLADTENYVPRQLTDEALDGKRSQRELIEEALAGTGRYNKRIHQPKGERYTPTGPEKRRGYVDDEAFGAAVAKKAEAEKISLEEAANALRSEGTLTDQFFGEQLYKPGTTVDGEVMGSVEGQIAAIIERNGGDYSLFVDDINVALKGWVDQVAPRVGEVATETILTQDGIILQRLAEYAKFPSAAAVTASKKLNKAEEVFSAASAKVVERAYRFQHAVGEEKALAKQALEEAQRNADLAEDAVDAAVREEAEIFSRESGLQQEVLDGNAEADDIQRILDEVEGKIPESEGEQLVRLEAERQKLIKDLDRVASNPTRIRYAYNTVASATARKIHIEQQLRSIFGSGENFDEFQRVLAGSNASEMPFGMEITLPDGSVLNEQQIQDAMGRLEEVLDMEDASGVGLWMGVEREIDVLNLKNQANNPANKAAYMLDKINTELDDAVGVAQRYMDVTGEEIVLPTPEAVMEAQQTIATVTAEFDQAVQAGDRLPGELTEYLTSNPDVAQALKTYYASGDLPSPTYLPDMGALDDIGQQVGAKIAGRLDELSAEIGARGSQLNLSYVDSSGKEQILTVRDYVYLRQMRNAIETQGTTGQIPIGFSRPGIDELDVDWNTVAGGTAPSQGTNPGGFATDAKGNQYYVKRYDEITPEGPRLDADGNRVPSVDRAASEVLANAVYRELGFGAPSSYMSIGPDGSAYHIAPLIDDFQTAQAIQAADGSSVAFWENNVDDLFVWSDPNTGAQQMGMNPPPGATAYALNEVVGQGFMADVLLSNWDAVGQGADNIGITPWALQEASVVRIDNGAAFFNRAQGIPKADGGWDWRSVSEFADDRFQTGQVAGRPDPGLQAQQLDHLLALRARYGGWEGFVKRHAPELSEDQIRTFSQFLEVRSEVLAESFDKPFLEAGSTDLRKSAYFSQGYKPDDIDDAFEGFVDPNDVYTPKQQTAKKDGFPAWMSPDEETQAISFVPLKGPNSAFDKIGEGMALGNGSAAAIQRDLDVLDAIENYKMTPVEIDGEVVSQFDGDLAPFLSRTGGLDETTELSWRGHDDFWGGEAPDNVSYGVVILDENDNVVMRMPTDGADGEPFGGVKWTFPKGRPDVGETPFQAASREALEETGLNIDLIAPLPGEFPGSTGTTFYFVGRVRPGSAMPVDVMKSAAPVPTAGGAMAPSPASLAASGNLEAEQLANVELALNHTTRQGLPNVWQEYARLSEQSWGDKWGKNMTPGNVAYGMGGDVYQLTANVPNGAQNIKIYGLPPREAQLAAQLTLQMGLETNPAKLTSIIDRLDSIVAAGRREVGVRPGMMETSQFGVEGLAPMMVDQWARVLDQDSELASLLMERFMMAKTIRPETAEAFTFAKRLKELSSVGVDENIAPEVAQVVQRLSSMNTDEQLELAINLVEMDLVLKDLLTEEGALEALAHLKGLDSSSPFYLDNRADAHEIVRYWAADVDQAITKSQAEAATAAQSAGETYRAKPVEFQAKGARSEGDRTQRIHAQFLDLYKRTLANDGYTMAAWMNVNDQFPSTIPNTPPMGGGAHVVPNIIAVNPMAFDYKSMGGKVDPGGGWTPPTGGEANPGFVGASGYVQDFERMMEAQIQPPSDPLNLDEDALEALVARQSEVLATVENVKAEHSNSVAQLKSAERRLEEAVVDAADKQAHAVAQRQIVMELGEQQEVVDGALDTLNRLGIGEGVDINDIADDDLIALRQATEILIQADSDMNRLAFSEIENGADGWFDLVSKTAEQRADIHRIGNREIILDTAFHTGFKPMGTIFQGPKQMVESMQAAERFVARGGAKAFFRKYDKLHNLLRGYMIMKPGFHGRNFMSAVFMNHLAGMNWSSYRRFMRAYWKFQEEEAVRLGMPDRASKMRKAMKARGINPSNVSAEHVDYVRQLADSGALGGAGAQVASEFVDTGARKGSKAFTVKIGGKKVDLWGAINPTSSQNLPLRLSKNFGMATETFVRGSLGFDTLLKGDSVDSAFENVMKFHFDYDDLSDFERNVVKKVVPFYTWTRKNLPLMFEMAARRPAVFNKYNSFKKEMEYGQERPKVIPQWMERQGAIQTPWKYDGENMFILPDMPFKAPMELLEPSLRFTTEDSAMDRIQTAMASFGTQITPLIKAPYEWKAKQNLWKGYNFDGGYEVVPRAYAKVPFLMDLLSLPGIAAKNSKGQWAMKDYELHAIAQLMPTLSDLRRLYPDEERYQKRAVSTWISFMFGAGLRTNTKWEQDKELQSRLYEMRDEMKQERSLSGARL